MKRLRWAAASTLTLAGSLVACSSAPRVDSSGRVPNFVSSRFSARDLSVYTVNSDAWLAKLRLLESAREGASLAYYTLEADESTAVLLDELIKKTRQNPRFEVKILVDYWQSQAQLPLLKFLAAQPGFEVRRHGAPDPSFVEGLRSFGVDPTEFLVSLMKSDKEGLLASIRNSKLISMAGAIRESVAARTRGRGGESDPGRSLSFVSPILASQSRDPNVAAVLKGLRAFLHWNHFKLTLADRRCFVMGGRNLSDQYHLEPKDPRVKERPYVFLDTDVGACESSAGAQTASFAGLWNSPRNVKVNESLFEKTPAPALGASEFSALASRGRAAMPSRFSAAPLALAGSATAVVADNQPPVSEKSANILREYVSRIRALKKGESLVLVNAYFYLDDQWPLYVDQGRLGARSLSNLHDAVVEAARNGVDVSVYTNSDATTDLAIVNYQAFRGYRELVEAGVKLFELAPDQGSLHSKAAVFGDREMAVGSFNLDPRSHLYDTNNVLFFEGARSAELTAGYLAQVRAFRWNAVDEGRLKVIDDTLRVPDAGKQKLFRAINAIREVL